MILHSGYIYLACLDEKLFMGLDNAILRYFECGNSGQLINKTKQFLRPGKKYGGAWALMPPGTPANSVYGKAGGLEIAGRRNEPIFQAFRVSTHCDKNRIETRMK